MRLSGIAAGIATLAVLGITYNLLYNWNSIGPGATVESLIPATTDYWQATIGAVAVICVAFAYQRSRFGRQLRAAREDPAAARAAGIDIHRQRLLAFTLSGALSGFAGGLYVHLLGSIGANQVYLDLTFLTLAMLVVGGISSLFGAVVGAITISLFNILLVNAAARDPRLRLVDHGAERDEPRRHRDRHARDLASPPCRDHRREGVLDS